MTGELLRAGDILQSGMRLEFYIEDDELERYESRILELGSKQIVVTVPKDRTGQGLAIQPLTDFKALILDKSCRYVFSTVFEKETVLDDREAWFITKPKNIIRYQNRDNVRVRANLNLVVRMVDEEGAIGDPLKVPMIDISGGGLCFVAEKYVNPGTQIGVEIRNMPEVGSVEVMGRVVRCHPVDTTGRHPIYHVGVAFGELPRAVTNKIIRFIFSVQRKDLAKGIASSDF